MKKIRKPLVSHLTAAAALDLLVAGSQASASALSVNPVHLVVAPDKKTAMLTIGNDGEAPISIRITAQAWVQRSGKDYVEPASDVIVSPPIATIAHGHPQLVRIGPTNHDRSRERAYRIVIEEIPTAATAGQINMALRLDLPMYIPAGRRAEQDLHWQAVRKSDGTVALNGADMGLAHAQLRRVSVVGRSVVPFTPTGSAGVILPGSAKQWTLPATWKAQLRGDAELLVETDESITRVQVRAGAN